MFFTADRHGPGRTSHGLTISGCYLHGFQELTYSDAVICMGFQAVPFKTYANTNRSSKQLLKTHSKCINKNIHKSIHRNTRSKIHRKDQPWTHCILVLFAWVFMNIANYDAAIRIGFKVTPLKTHANTSRSSKQLTKTHSKCINTRRSSQQKPCQIN